MPHQYSEEWKYAMFLVSYPDTISASITVAWYWFLCLVLQPTGLLLPYLPFSSPPYTLFLLTDSITFYFVLVLTDLFSDFSRSFQIPNDPVLQSACSKSQQDMVSKWRTNPVVSPCCQYYSEYFQCSIIHGSTVMACA